MAQLQQLQAEYQEICQQLSSEALILKERDAKKAALAKLDERRDRKLTQAIHSFEKLARLTKKRDEALEEKRKIGFLKLKSVKTDSALSLKETVHLASDQGGGRS